MNFGKFVTGKSWWENEADIKSIYRMLSEFGPSSGKSMLKILIAEDLNKRGVDISSWNY